MRPSSFQLDFVFAVVSLVSLFNCLDQVHSSCDSLDAFGCVSQVLTSSDSNIECSGYHSCQNSTISVSDTGKALCLGSSSCINASIAASTQVTCRGFAACAGTSIQTQGTSGYIYGAGALAFFDATIILGGSSSSTSNAYRELTSAHIYLSSSAELNVRSFMGATDSIVESSSATINVNFLATQSAHNATVICNAGHTCNIECYGDACNNVNLVDNGGTFSVSCTFSPLYSQVCPNGDQIASFVSKFLDQMPDLTNLTHLDDIYLPYYNDSNSIACDDGRECDKSFSNFSSLWCRGAYSCTNAEWTGASDVPGEVAIVCDGAYCGKNANLQAPFGGDIYVRAHSASDSSSITLSTTTDYDIYCIAYQSCSYSQISNAKDVYCLGGNPCFRSTIKQVDNVFVYGWISSVANPNIQISDISGSLFCKGYYACKLFTINNVGDSVFGQGYRVLASTSSITNVTNTVAVFGQEAMASIQLSQITSVYCHGYRCLSSSSIQNVEKIVVTGGDSLEGASITSNLYGTRTKTEFELMIYDDNSEAFNVDCSVNDVCFIGCYDQSACTHMDLSCHGTCYVDCEPDDIDCPVAVFGNYTLSTFSSAPSKIPTVFPSVLPSTDPSSFPSNFPSGSPSSFPSNVPSSFPSDFPSEFPSQLPSECLSALPTAVLALSSMPSDAPIYLVRPTNETLEQMQITNSTTSTSSGAQDQVSAHSESKECNDSSDVVVALIVCLVIISCGFLAAVGVAYTLYQKLKLATTQTEMQSQIDATTRSDMNMPSVSAQSPVEQLAAGENAANGVNAPNAVNGAIQLAPQPRADVQIVTTNGGTQFGETGAIADTNLQDDVEDIENLYSVAQQDILKTSGNNGFISTPGANAGGISAADAVDARGEGGSGSGAIERNDSQDIDTLR